MNEKQGVEVTWKQEDYDGKLITLTIEFGSRREAIRRIKEMKKVARELGKYFEVEKIRRA